MTLTVWWRFTADRRTHDDYIMAVANRWHPRRPSGGSLARWPGTLNTIYVTIELGLHAHVSIIPQCGRNVVLRWRCWRPRGYYVIPKNYVYYPAYATLVCLLSDISPGVAYVCVFSRPIGTDISATVTPIDVNLCTAVELCPGTVSSPLVAISLWVSKCAVKKGLRVDHFWHLRYRFCHLTANISKAVSRSVTCQLELNISST